MRIAGSVKKTHFVGTHHQPINSHHTTQWCLSFIDILLNTVTVTLSPPQYGQTMLSPFQDELTEYITEHKTAYH